MAQTPPLPKGATYVDDPPLPKGATYVDDSSQKPTATSQPETTLQKIGQGATDFAKGMGEGALSTLSVADDWSRKHLPAFFTNSNFGFGPPADIERLKELTRPTNTMQRIGKGTEQVGEFLLPTGLEEGAVKFGTGAFGNGAELASRMAGSAVHTGAINKTQGGSFTGGAAAGAVGAAAGAGLKKIAPKLAEAALNVRGTDRAYGRTPGEAILKDTTAIKPGKIAQQASGKVDDLTHELETMAQESPNSVSLLPAREVAEDAYNNAVSRNNESTIKKIRTMAKQLGEDHEGNEIPEITSPSQLLHLKRGVGDLQTSWNPATAPKWVNGQVGRVYHALDDEFDRAVPEGADLNRRISTLLPVAQRANAAELNAGLAQRAIGRFKAHTGALALPIGLGSAEGYRHGGVPGAILGGTLGLIGTETLASPETWIAAARGAYSPVTGKILIPAATSTGLQLSRPKVFQDHSE
jgi:hypothetical protein